MSASGSTAREVEHPRAIAAVIALGVVGSIVFLLLPLLVGAFSERLGLEAAQVGYLASADMVGMFVAAALATLWIRRSDWRLAALAGSLLLAACHLASALVVAWPLLLAIRLAAGIAGGSLMSIALTSLGDTRSSDRLFALFISAQLGLGALALWRMPELLDKHGLPGVFVALAVLTVLTGATIPLIPRGGAGVVAQAAAARSGSMLAGALALAACLVFNLGIMAVWAYMERLGDAAGLSAAVIGEALGASLLVGLFGALVAAVMADHFGRALPIGLSLVLQLVALALLAGEPSVGAYRWAVALFSFCWNFPVAYQLAITVAVDPSGKLVVLFLSAVKLGYAIGPAIAGQLVALTGGFGAVIMLGAVCFVASAGVYLPLARLVPRAEEGRA
jgi:predicted MFS family arabinose efflux permease